jgi:hypothetical protein
MIKQATPATSSSQMTAWGHRWNCLPSGVVALCNIHETLIFLFWLFWIFFFLFEMAVFSFRPNPLIQTSVWGFVIF